MPYLGACRKKKISIVYSIVKVLAFFYNAQVFHFVKLAQFFFFRTIKGILLVVYRK